MSVVIQQPVVWIVLVSAIVVGAIHTLAVRGVHDSAVSPGQGLQPPISAGLSVVGILPAVFVILQINSGHLTKPALADLFVASAWLSLSVLFGLYVAYVAVTRPGWGHGTKYCFGYQLIALLAGVCVFFWGIVDVVFPLIGRQG